MIRKYAEIFCWKNVISFCSAKATHIFSAKNTRILRIESAKTVNEMTFNELVKLTTLWTTGPWWVFMRYLLHLSGQQQHILQWLQAMGMHEMQWAQVLDSGPWLQVYMVPGNCTPLVRPDKLEVVASFCYIGDMLSAAIGYEHSTTTCVKTTWKKFKELLPVLSSYLSFKTRGHVYSSCVCLCWGFTAQSTQWGHVEHGQFT